VKKSKFPLLAVLVSLPLLVALIMLEEQVLPLMTRLFMSEFGAFMSGFAAYFSLRSLRQNGFRLLDLAIVVLGSLMAIKFAMLGFQLWQGLGV
jgi:hypothetical protein